MKKNFADILGGIEAEQKQKLMKKIPGWAAAGEMNIPSKLALEQCSSSATAEYKASLFASRYGHPGTVCDLTGGLGVDSSAFAAIAGRLHYFERSPELCSAALENFARLGIGNMEIHNEETGPDSDIPQADLIYADPARRDTVGKKVFLLEDCTPNILEILPMLMQKAPVLMFKLSPMADIDMLAKRFGDPLKEIHVISLAGEVKELLCILERGWSGGYSIHATELQNAADTLSFTPSEAAEAQVRYADGIQAGQYLIEPSSVILKAGAFKLLCSRFGIAKLDASTHLYISDAPMDSSLFKSFPIREVIPFGNAGIKDVARRYPKAELSARNLPIATDALRKKMGISSGGDTHIFACNSLCLGKVLIVCATC